MKNRPHSEQFKSAFMIRRMQIFCKALSKLIKIIIIINICTRKIIENEVSPQSVCNILKKHKLHLYKMHYVQELVHEDFDWRMKFYEIIEVRGNNFANDIDFFNGARARSRLWISPFDAFVEILQLYETFFLKCLVFEIFYRSDTF